MVGDECGSAQSILVQSCVSDVSIARGSTRRASMMMIDDYSSFETASSSCIHPSNLLRSRAVRNTSRMIIFWVGALPLYPCFYNTITDDGLTEI